MGMSLDPSQPAEPAEPAAKGTADGWGTARVLVVVPVPGDGASTPGRALASLQAQRDERPDVVVVAPACRADVATVVERHAARLVVLVDEDAGVGVAAAVNAGLRAASSMHRYVTWLGPDDVLLPGALRTAAAALDADPGAVLAFGDCRHESADGDYLFTPHTRVRVRHLLGVGAEPPAPAATLFRLAAIGEVGGLDEGLRYALDLDLLLRLRRLGRFAATGRTLAAFRCPDPGVVIGRGAAAVAETRAVLARHTSEALRPLAAAWRGPVRLTGRRPLPRVQRAVPWLEPATGGATAQAAAAGAATAGGATAGDADRA